MTPEKEKFVKEIVRQISKEELGEGVKYSKIHKVDVFNPQTDLVETKNLALNARDITNDMRDLVRELYS